ACMSFGLRTSGVSSVETVKADAYIMMVCPSGSDCETRFAPTRPPAPSQFSTITGWPYCACSFSARMRAMVSDALPGVTPETKRTVFVGNCCACAIAEKSTATNSETGFMDILLCFGHSELRREPVGRLAAVPVGTVIGIVPSVLHHQKLHRARDAL